MVSFTTTHISENIRTLSDASYDFGSLEKLTPSPSFEPTNLAIFRGSMAVFASVGLLVFSIYTIFIQLQLYVKGSRSISETSIGAYITSNDGEVSHADGDPTLSVTVVGHTC